MLGAALGLLALSVFTLRSMCQKCYAANVDGNDTVCGPSSPEPYMFLRLGLCGAHSL